MDAVWASCHYYKSPGRKRSIVNDPIYTVTYFLETELSVGDLNEILPPLWLTGSRQPAAQLQLQSPWTTISPSLTGWSYNSS